MHFLIDNSGFADAVLSMILKKLFKFWAELGIMNDFEDDLVIEVVGTKNKLVFLIDDK